MEPELTVFHLTHIKAGSQWVLRVLGACAPERIVPQQPRNAQVLHDVIAPGKIYPAVYLSKPRFDRVMNFPPGLNAATLNFLKTRRQVFLKNWVNFGFLNKPLRHFVVMRDLRDTLISLYFSLKVSHEVANEHIQARRQALQGLSLEEGLISLMENELVRIADNQSSWVGADTLVLKFEELLQDEYAGFERIMDHCEISVSPQKLRACVEKHTFAQLAGRDRGEEDIASHYRKGIVGDWNNHFSSGVKGVFKERYGSDLMLTGYEKDLDW